MIRRNNYQISRDILALAIGGVNKTRMVYGANLNFKLIKTYLADLIARGLIVQDGALFHTTGEGRAFIHQVANTEEAWAGIPGELINA